MTLRKTNNEVMNDAYSKRTSLLPLRRMANRRAINGHAQAGFSLLELVVTLTVLTIMTLGVIPLIKTSVKRQREQQLREELREMREAIKQFHRDAAVPCAPNAAGFNGGTTGTIPGAISGTTTYVDPRSKVCVSDPTIFTVDNPDHYPPTLDMLKDGVDVKARQPPASDLLGSTKGDFLERHTLDATPKKKVYLREIPVDPMTGKADWELRSVYDAADASAWGSENVFDIHSKSNATSLNGEKYSEW